MNADQLQYALTALTNLLRAGISPAEALREMQLLQPSHAAFWQQASLKASHGIGLAAVLKPLLDDAMHSAITAAELSGTASTVLARLAEAMEERKQVKKTLKTMGYPFAMLLAAVAVFVFYLGVVVPGISRFMPKRPGSRPTALQQIGESFNTFLTQYWVHLLVVLIVAGVALFLWLRNPENRDSVLAAFDRMPLLGAAARDLFYGEWATHMSINTQAGITVHDAIHLTANILPGFYRQEVLAVAKDMTRLGQAEAAMPRSDTDPRHRIPFMITNAFRLGDRTGISDENFKSAAEVLIAQGKLRVSAFVSVANGIITPAAVILGAGATLPYFMQITDSISRMH